MPRTRFTAMEKLDILTGLSQTNLTRAKYLERHGIHRSTIRTWKEHYKREGLDGLEERHSWTRYSEEAKRQAVETYLNGKDSLAEIRNRFGLRSTKQLRDWINKFQYNGTNKSLTATPSRRQVRIMSRKTTFEERIKIVEYVTAGKHSYSQAAEHFNVSYQQVRSWVLKSKDGGYKTLKDRRGRTKPIEEMTEVERLKLENRQLKSQLKEQEVMEFFAKKFRELQNKE
ncbi:transposase [Levilactobacillus senmaizukei DSM 21775 = NBRC 103853]|uniref:Transposase n=1 Tax=Levilactobacillus senmaizukei DSM 21775 = NBRC 103853 TaxID=1423803 RepID=A0A0R2DDU5_9LACO|nr:helix-turn-helix domain-containing protein [Levilactobacillus senmaizukei]KRN02129.1 transposase [Levilactobacillus senmaizukei DSM 21775 = NBRC 103853]